MAAVSQAKVAYYPVHRTASVHSCRNGRAPRFSRTTVSSLDFCDQQLLRACLARSILLRLAKAPPDSSLAHLGILSLQAPPAPPAFHRLASDLSRLYSHTTAPVRGQSARVWGEQRQPCCGAASCGDDDEKDHHYLSDAVETAEAVLCRHFGPPLPYNGYTTPSGKQCRLAPGDTVRHFLHPSVESFVMSLFRCIEDQRTPLVTLGPHCLFHAHLFRALPPAPGVGLLFHACEYPAYHEVHFPYRLGHCQEGSHLRPAGQQLAHRNLLWYQDKLVVLDVSSGSLLRHALWEETSELCTLYEEDFGIPMLDLTLDVVERSAWRYAKLLASLR